MYYGRPEELKDRDCGVGCKFLIFVMYPVGIVTSIHLLGSLLYARYRRKTNERMENNEALEGSGNATESHHRDTDAYSDETFRAIVTWKTSGGLLYGIAQMAELFIFGVPFLTIPCALIKLIMTYVNAFPMVFAIHRFLRSFWTPSRVAQVLSPRRAILLILALTLPVICYMDDIIEIVTHDARYLEQHYGYDVLLDSSLMEIILSRIYFYFKTTMTLIALALNFATVALMVLGDSAPSAERRLLAFSFIETLAAAGRVANVLHWRIFGYDRRSGRTLHDHHHMWSKFMMALGGSITLLILAKPLFWWPSPKAAKRNADAVREEQQQSLDLIDM